MAAAFPPSIDELQETFQDLEDWQDRYEYILDLGKELPRLPDELQTDKNKVHGCMSTVWMEINRHDAANQTIQIQADSDSLIVRGLIVLLLSLYDGKAADEVAKEDPQSFFGSLGLNQHLSPNRRNGLYSMVGRIREESVRLAAESL